MAVKGFFLDTYALHEILVGNPAYEKFESETCIATTKLNLMELYYTFFVRYGEKQAKHAYQTFLDYCLEIDDELIQEAMKLRAHANKKKSLSYVDCVGYALARNRNLVFVTGDKGFQDMPGVEFIH